MQDPETPAPPEYHPQGEEDKKQSLPVKHLLC